MKIFLDKNVFEAALDRMRYLFDEFPNVVVSFSGGKDSTVIFNLALMVATERGRLPLKVMWIDQEAEWQATVDYAEKIMTREDVDPYWYQMPMVITNNASAYNRYSYCWAEEEQDNWIHPKHPISKKENRFGTERFHALFTAIFRVEFPDLKSCYLSGVRAEENPKRLMGLTTRLTYKNITWGKMLNKAKQHITFCPIYDWSYTDIWKAIYDNDWPYNRIYDEYYRYGMQVKDMRVSNLHHETAIQNLLIVQEIEPKTWNRIALRIDGANTIKHIRKNSFTCPAELPFMFKNWEEYALYLVDNLIQEDQYKRLILKVVDQKRKVYDGELISNDFGKIIINTILSSDWDLTKLKNWELSAAVAGYRDVKGVTTAGRQREVKFLRERFKDKKYLTAEQVQKVLDRWQGENGQAD